MNNSHQSPFFSVEVHSAGFIPHRFLFLDDVEEVLDRANYRGSHIYYLARVPKIRFDTAQCELTGWSLSAQLLVMPDHIVSMEVELRRIYPFSLLSEPELSQFSDRLRGEVQVLS